MSTLTSILAKHSVSAALILGVGALTTGCDWGFRGTAVATYGSGYNNREDRIYCNSLYPTRYSNWENDFNGCLNNRNTYRSSYTNNNNYVCSSGGTLSYRNVCRTRYNYWGSPTNECVNMPTCIGAGFFPNNDASDQSVTSMLSLFPSMAKVNANKGNGYDAVKNQSTGMESTLLLATNGRSLGETLASIGPESVAVVDGVSVPASRSVRSAILQSFDQNRAPMRALGFQEKEIEEFMVRQDASGASDETYQKVAQKLDMPATALKSFIAGVLGLVVDTRWEIYNAENPNP